MLLLIYPVTPAASAESPWQHQVRAGDEEERSHRRIAVYRYGPSWGYFRLPYRPSPELLERLTPRRRGLVYPHQKEVLPPGRAA